MTFRTSLARYLRGLLQEEIPPPSVPPTPSPTSTPPTTTRSTTTSSNGASEAGLLSVVLQTMKEMQSENLKEIRGMVTDLMQGRPPTREQLEAMAAAGPDPQPSRTPFDPPDYDDPGTDDLPESLQAVFSRQEQEQHDVRLLRTEQEVLAQQLDEARRQLMDPQGPTVSELS